MKNIKLFLTLFLLLSGTKVLPAQNNYYAVAVTSNGILTEKKISLEELRSLNAINGFSTEDNQLKKIPVTSFRITLIEKGTEPRVFDCQTEILNDDIKAELKKLNTGVKIYFEYIKASLPDNTTRSLAPIALEVM